MSLKRLIIVVFGIHGELAPKSNNVQVLYFKVVEYLHRFRYLNFSEITFIRNLIQCKCYTNNGSIILRVFFPDIFLYTQFLRSERYSYKNQLLCSISHRLKLIGLVLSGF